MDINAFAGSFGEYGELLLAIVGVCAAIAALLPAPKAESGKFYRAVYTALNFLAVNFGHARNATAPKDDGKQG